MPAPITETRIPAKWIESRRMVAKRLGVGETTVKRLVREGRLPRPKRITANRVGWDSADIDAFIASLESA
jgi:excisionase family DNA binding protein